MKVTKMHGLGNDFIVFSDPEGADKDYSQAAIKWCDRRTGIGADGAESAAPAPAPAASTAPAVPAETAPSEPRRARS